MKNKIFQITFVAIIALSISLSLFVGDVSKAGAQSSRVWSDPINLSNSGSASNPVLVVDTLGKTHVFWIDEFDGYRYAQSSDGKEWTSSKGVTYPFNVEGTPPVFVAGKNGFIYVFYQNRDETLIFAQAHSDNLEQPAAWAFRSDLSKNVLAMSVSIDQLDVLHVAYIRNADSILGPAGIYYTQSSDGGRSWSTEKLLYASQYFRTTTPDIAHLQVVTSGSVDDKKVYVLWDNVPLKRIFMSTSSDSGLSWADAIQLKGPEDAGGSNTPYNVSMSAVGEKVLLTWEVGEPGSSQCVLFGQWSNDGGSTWGESAAILDNRSTCPLGIDFLISSKDSIVALLRYDKINPSLLAWNGTEWSEPQPQNELSYFPNPITRETIFWGCQNYFVGNDRLFIVGCDEGGGKDVWMTSRPIVPIDDLYFSVSSWSLPDRITTTNQSISDLVYVSEEYNLHAVWSQSPDFVDNNSSNSIYYSRWDGTHWSLPQTVISGLTGPAVGLSSAISKQGRLYLAWTDKTTGDLLFSWSLASQANMASEWENPHNLPSLSQVSRSPDVLVDATGRIVVVYVVPFNEQRGVYLIQSADNGNTWSEPIKVFDAATTGWAMVNDAKITVDGNGRLHVLFSVFSGLQDHPEKLYYSQSSDGGLTWSAPEIINEGWVVWSDIVCYDGQTVHRLWQENDKSFIANLDQISEDGGSTWGKPINATDVSDVATPVTLALNATGGFHLMQLVAQDSIPYLKEYDLKVRDWKWDGSKWESQPDQEIKIQGEQANYSVAAGITTAGSLSVSVLASYKDLLGKTRNEIYAIDRTVDAAQFAATPFEPVIATSNGVPAMTESANVLLSDSPPSSTPNPVLYAKTPSSSGRNIAGVFLVVLVVALVVFVFLKRTGRKDHKS